MTNNMLDEYSKELFATQFNRIMRGLRIGASKSKSPKAFLLGGQSGVGKTRLQKILINKHGHNYIVINGDEYRSAHPNFTDIQKRYGLDAPAHTAKWAGEMVEALIDALSTEGYNLIIEGTLRTASVPLQTAQLLRKKGYDVSLALMAVKPEISLVSCQIRYEQMRIAGTTPRAVDPAHHAKIVKEIVGNLEILEASDLFNTVALFNRAGACLFQAKCPVKEKAASTALQDILFGTWTEEEIVHHKKLIEQLAVLNS